MLRTTTVPIVRSEERQIQAGETGVTNSVNPHAEGKDHAESQDASLTSDETRAAPMTQSAPQTKIDGKGRKVLIVEDTMELAEVIQATLERMNLITAHETHGSKAIARLNEMQPDVVLLDISLPDTTGWKILEHIREIDSSRMPIVIVITAYGDPANRLVGKLQGVYSYLVKPFTSDEVEKTVAEALSSAAR